MVGIKSQKIEFGILRVNVDKEEMQVLETGTIEVSYVQQ
jgi:hypothetical protein